MESMSILSSFSGGPWGVGMSITTTHIENMMGGGYANHKLFDPISLIPGGGIENTGRIVKG